MARFLRFAIFMACFLYAGGAFAAGGACPSGVPVTGNNCYFIAATGADTNNGTSESTPWLHAPGMPNCTAVCASSHPSNNSVWANVGIIFKGGDTWHFGNSGASPYTGGQWTWYWQGSSVASATCMYEGTQTGCEYIGVDKNWYSGGAWTRPILTGDNPTSTSVVSSCMYQVSPNNVLFAPGGAWGFSFIFDNFEFTGLCGQNTNQVDLGFNQYTTGANTGVGGNGMILWYNLYYHGWTATTGGAGNCSAIGGTNNGLGSWVNLVVDGSDSVGNICTWGYMPSVYHMKDSIIRYASDGVGQNCHDIHDNIFEYITPFYGGGHTNILECNYDNPGNLPGQPQNTPNVVYNNIIRHSNSNVMMWFCPTGIPEYWFNNLMYDDAGEGWSVAGPPGYSCSNAGGQFMFNNTFVDGTSGGYPFPCHLTGSNGTGGVYLTVYNNQLINTAYDGTGCTGGASSGTNVSQTDAQATTQGHTTGSASPGSPAGLSNTCANETTTPCAPTASSNGTVGRGSNLQSYCTTLASYSSEYAIGTEAANACRYDTTDACSYNATTHTMNCPGQTAVARPSSGAWDAGAYQFSGSKAPGLQPPTKVQATVN